MRVQLAAARVARLGTVRPDGTPHIVVCCFALAGDVAYSAVDDKPKTTVALQRLRNLTTNAAASLLVDHYDEDWTALWWIRLDGLGRVIADGSEHERAVALLCGKYEQYRHRRPTGPVIAVDVAAGRRGPDHSLVHCVHGP